MATVAFTLAIFLLVAAALALGLLLGRGPIKGSCGGISALTREDCPVCGGNPARCEATSPGTGEPYDAAAPRSAPERREP